MKQRRETRSVIVELYRKVEATNHTVRILAVPRDAKPREVRRFIEGLIDGDIEGPWRNASFIDVGPHPDPDNRWESGDGFELEIDDLSFDMSCEAQHIDDNTRIYRVARDEDGQLRLAE